MTTKIHLANDALGRPSRIILTPGQRGDAPIPLAFSAVDLSPMVSAFSVRSTQELALS